MSFSPWRWPVSGTRDNVTRRPVCPFTRRGAVPGVALCSGTHPTDPGQVRPAVTPSPGHLRRPRLRPQRLPRQGPPVPDQVAHRPSRHRTLALAWACIAGSYPLHAGTLCGQPGRTPCFCKVQRLWRRLRHCLFQRGCADRGLRGRVLGRQTAVIADRGRVGHLLRPRISAARPPKNSWSAVTSRAWCAVSARRGNSVGGSAEMATVPSPAKGPRCSSWMAPMT